ncbi:unnamed protein product [Rotaria magnacalcarata]|uniref:NAD(P)(+)--arginine ADP-ribosyltransferase n=1 Tax=Rotaria magnacalcarata TaxID=392030 RepID=A0A814YIP5_9BILA|nr:unnamed protein product [Rotaria magnacalcarata]
MDLGQQVEDCHLIGIVRPEKIRRPFSSRIVQNFILVWLHSDADEVHKNEFRKSITELRTVVNDINTFTDVDQCIEFVIDIKDEKVLMIISDELSQHIVPFVHDIIHINSIYIYSKNQSQQKEWIQKWPKVKDMFPSILSICQALGQDARRCDQDLVSISLVSTNRETFNENLDQLDPTFMYTQILKEILLAIDFNEQHIKDFITYYREKFTDNGVQLNNIDGLARDYKDYSPIWWYTHKCSLYSVLNRALRFMEVDTIIKMGFFIHDLHRQIVQLHSEQYREHHELEPFTIFRGQGLPKIELEKIRETQGGLISFNNFLSTSKDLSIAQGFASSSLASSDSVGIVFVMMIDPSIKSTPFACINHVSYYKTEDEILFSMHTVFRIDNIIQINDNNRLWQVDLIQTNDNDSQLNALTERIRNEIRGCTEWDKLGKLLFKLGHFDKAEELYDVLLEQTYSDREKIQFNHQLGWGKMQQRKYEEAIAYYQKSLEIKQIVMPDNHNTLAVSFNHIGSVYEKMNEYTKALLYYEKGLEFQLKITPLNYSGLASCLANIGSVYEKMKEYSKALEFHEKALEMRQNISPENNVNLAYSHHNIGSVYEKMGEYQKALLSHEKALEIQQIALPPNHRDLAQSHSSIGYVYSKIGQYSRARQYHQKSVDIGQRSLPANHPHLRKFRENLEYINRKCR